MQSMKQLVIHCGRKGCTKAVYLGELQVHLASNCKEASTINTLEQVMEQPTSASPTNLEMEAAGHVVRRKLLSQPQSQTPFSLPTGGCVSG
ncbi:MAG: hypothetical protein A6F71_09975 [Cycloclasticus sp. symbiont of Poecilosclerida sp. M]|nr:MAG: hypothetical protein A6F71_09975 [Cycloclasticus sp. symbiont of Poecilosclerida sp. M]